jgi:hypothetical protein
MKQLFQVEVSNVVNIKFVDQDHVEIQKYSIEDMTISDIVNIHKNIEGYRISDGRYFEKTGWFTVDYCNTEIEIQLDTEWNE